MQNTNESADSAIGDEESNYILIYQKFKICLYLLH